jgi:transcriptional regulator with XRE-family HTH domain
MKISQLRRKAKIMMIDKGLDKRGGITILSKKLGINRSALSMYLSGYRDGKASEDALKAILNYLGTAQ